MITAINDQITFAHEEAIIEERNRRQRLVITCEEIRVGDILDFDFVTDVKIYGLYTRDVTVRYGCGEWTLPYGANEIVSVHR